MTLTSASAGVRPCYAMSGTDIPYGLFSYEPATRCPLLSCPCGSIGDILGLTLNMKELTLTFSKNGRQVLLDARYSQSVPCSRRVCCAMSGADQAYGSAYACAMRCPVPTECMVLPGGQDTALNPPLGPYARSHRQ
eukprot:241464-Rhodomonas_salina.2